MKSRAFSTLALLLVSLSTPCGSSADKGTSKSDLPDLEGKKVLMVIASRKFRDEELFEPRKILLEAGAEVKVASSKLGESIGMLGGKAEPAILLSEVKARDYDAIVFVGGVGAKEFWDDEVAHKTARGCLEQEKILGAICIAPITLANAGVLKDRKATVFASVRDQLTAKGAKYTGRKVEVDGRIITANGPESARLFGEAIARALAEKSQPTDTENQE